MNRSRRTPTKLTRAAAALALPLAGGSEVAGMVIPPLCGPRSAVREIADDEAEYRERARRLCVEAAERHIELGVWCRDAGLVVQAGNEFITAAEEAGDHYPRAARIVRIMDRLDDRFWRKVTKRPSKSLLDTYGKRANKARKSTVVGRARLAEWAGKRELVELAEAEYLRLLQGADGKLVIDRKGRIELPFDQTVSEEISERLLASAITINGERYLRDGVLRALPQIESLFQVEGERMRVRSLFSVEQATELHALCHAVLPLLEEDVGARVDRLLTVLVVDTRARFEAALDALKLAGHKAATGVAIPSERLALICGEGLALDTLRGTLLHEFAHLVELEVSRAAMPSWYMEGFAEQYGGTGTFRWNGKELEVGGILARNELAPILGSDYLPLDRLLAGNALALLTENKVAARYFYAESWALIHYLRHHAAEELRERFATWEAMCRGKSLGAKAGDRNARNPAAATNLYLEMFGQETEVIEAGFREWLATLE